MRYLLQLPFPDELLSSVWMRTARRAGLPIGTATRAITIDRKLSPTMFSSAHLADLAVILRRSPEDLLWHHTVFPYATAYLRASVLASARASALSTGRAATGLGAVTQNVSDHVRWRRFCPNCVSDDLARCGESYWRRSHHLPGVLTCSVHGTPLMQTTLACVSKRWSDRLPHECRDAASQSCRPTAFDTELARRSVALLRREPGIGLERDGTWYRDRLVAVGLLMRDRFADSELLAKWGRRQLPRDPALFGLAERDIDMHWLALMVRPKAGIPFVPLKHVLFETLLVMQRPVARPWVTFKPPGPSARLKPDLDKHCAEAVRAVIRGHIEKGERVRVCDALSQARCWTNFRHDRKSFPRVQAAIRWLKRSSACCRPNWGKGSGCSTTRSRPSCPTTPAETLRPGAPMTDAPNASLGVNKTSSIALRHRPPVRSGLSEGAQ